jgi:hypothetical protein
MNPDAVGAGEGPVVAAAHVEAAGEACGWGAVGRGCVGGGEGKEREEREEHFDGKGFGQYKTVGRGMGYEVVCNGRMGYCWRCIRNERGTWEFISVNYN